MCERKEHRTQSITKKVTTRRNSSHAQQKCATSKTPDTHKTGDNQGTQQVPKRNVYQKDYPTHLSNKSVPTNRPNFNCNWNTTQYRMPDAPNYKKSNKFETNAHHRQEPPTH